MDMMSLVLLSDFFIFLWYSKSAMEDLWNMSF